MLFRTSTNTTTTTTKSSSDNQATKPVAQNTTKSYLNRPSLQALLEKLFPGQTEFNIEVCQPYPGPPLDPRIALLMVWLLWRIDER
jgi:hypothetical protein